MEEFVEKTNSENTNVVKNMIESQEMIDEIMVKNCDDSMRITDENTAAIKHLERLIEK